MGVYKVTSDSIEHFRFALWLVCLAELLANFILIMMILIAMPCASRNYDYAAETKCLEAWRILVEGSKSRVQRSIIGNENNGSSSCSMRFVRTVEILVTKHLVIYLQVTASILIQLRISKHKLSLMFIDDGNESDANYH